MTAKTICDSKHWIVATRAGNAISKCGKVFTYDEKYHYAKFDSKKLACITCKREFDKWHKELK